MKHYEIDKVFTQKVTEFLMDGWVINSASMCGHQGEQGKVDLIKGDELIRVWLSYESDNAWSDDYATKFHGYKTVLRVGVWKYPAEQAMDCWATVWMKDLEVIYEKSFYEICRRGTKQWFTEDLDEALRAQCLRNKRAHYHYHSDNVQLIDHTEAQLIARDYLVRKVGYQRVSSHKIRVKKQTYPAGNIKYLIIYNDHCYTLK